MLQRFTLAAILCLSLCCLFASIPGYGQGCVAVRHMSSCTAGSSSALLQKGHFQASAAYRYFRSDRHFVGREEQKQRKEQHTEVINVTHALDLSVTYALTGRLNATLVLPFISNDRSSLYEHLGNGSGQRFHTQSRGLGDLRLSVNYWLLDPLEHLNSNLSIGVGLKAPTGDYRAEDDFVRAEGSVRRPVDQSIQLGDGGWATSLELQAFGKIFENGSVYANAFYMFNPRNTNGVATGRRDSVEVGGIVSVMSVADQYMARAGMNYTLLPQRGLSVSLGGRVEGIPARDLIGKSDGFRRPGYIVAAEPGLVYMPGKTTVAVNLPVALVRDRIRSVYDIKTGRHGDAAFADYALYVTVSQRF
ncbi:MAG TPA: hypothetical protein VF646_20630 [Cytophagales bacterium]